MTYIRSAPAPSHIRPEEILSAVLKVCRTDEHAFCGRSRHAETVAARTIFCVLCRALTQLSYTDIARMMCRVNHSTAIGAAYRYRDNPEPLRSRMEAARVLAELARDKRDNMETKARLFA